MSVYTLFIMLYLKHTNWTLWITSYKIPSYERGLRAATKKVNDRFFNFFVIAFILASLNLHNVGKLKWILKVANFLNLYFLLATVLLHVLDRIHRLKPSRAVTPW